MAGASAGSVVISTAKGVGVKCAKEKWERLKAIVATLHEEVGKGEPVGRNELENTENSSSTFRGSTPLLPPI
jgi:hypothetical protein